MALPAHPRTDLQQLATLRTSYEDWLVRHRAAIAAAPADRLVYAWAAVENDCVLLSGILYGDGTPLDEVRAMLADSARAHLELVRLRGASHDATKPAPSDGYSTGSSRSTFLAMCRAFASGDFSLGRALASFVWDPPKARYLGRGSMFGSERAQRVAYALRDLLLDKREAAQAHLDPLKQIPEDLIGEVLMVEGLVRSEPARVLKGLGLELAWHHKEATTPANTKLPTYLLCIPALGLAALALHEAVIEADTLSRNNPDFPVELIVGGAR